MKSRVQAIAMPPDALLARYAADPGYTDCYAVDLPRVVGLAAYVEAFYTGGVFRIERWLLRWLLGRPSTDAEARQVALGEIAAFAAWRVEDRRFDQLLMCDVHGRTRSWFMVSPRADGGGTRLYFGSAVVPLATHEGGPPRMGTGFRVLLGFHRWYSRVLLAAAGARARAVLSMNTSGFLLAALLLVAAAVPRDARASWYRQCLYSGTLVSAPTRIIDRTSGKRRMEFRFYVRDGVALAGTAGPSECTSLSGREITVRMSPRIFSAKPRVGEVRHLRYYYFEDMCDIGGGACYEEDYKFVTASEARRLVVPAPSEP